VSVETYYSLLGVAETATQQEIKAAYRKLVRQVHPDSLPGASADWKRAAEEKTKEINEAYGVLSDSTMRCEYDRLLKKQGETRIHDQPVLGRDRLASHLTHRSHQGHDR
jgi:curved DNA-binding protein